MLPHLVSVRTDKAPERGWWQLEEVWCFPAETELALFWRSKHRFVFCLSASGGNQHLGASQPPPSDPLVCSSSPRLFAFSEFRFRVNFSPFATMAGILELLDEQLAQLVAGWNS